MNEESLCTLEEIEALRAYFRGKSPSEYNCSVYWSKLYATLSPLSLSLAQFRADQPPLCCRIADTYRHDLGLFSVDQSLNPESATGQEVLREHH
jgi:hypothetical protein